MKSGLLCGVVAATMCVASAEVCVKDGDRVAFLGDSITQLGDMPAGYVNMVMKGLEIAGVKGAVKIPAGLGGNKSTQMSERLDRDVLVKRPQWMLFSCGVNDVWHGKNGVELERYEALVSGIFDRCAASNVNVIVLTATMISENAQHPNNIKLAGYNDWLRAEAKRRGYRLADLNADMQAELARLKAEDPKRGGNLLTIDGVHMKFPGNCMMAWGILRTMGVNPALKDRVFKAFRQMPQAYSLNIGFTAEQWEKFQRRCEAERREANLDVAREMLIGKTETGK